MIVYTVIVPIHHVVQIIQTQSPCRVHRFVDGTGSQSRFTLKDHHLDALGTGAFERQRHTGRRRAAVSRRAGVGLEKQCLAFHLGVT